MSMLMATIAFALALGALWFTSELAKRADTRGKILVKPHLSQVNASIANAEQQIRDLSRSLERAEAEIRELKAFRTADEALKNAQRDPLDMIMRPAGATTESKNAGNQKQFRPTGT